MSAAVMPAYEWETFTWKTFQRKVYKLQTRIYRASRRGDVRTVHRLQRLLMKSFTAKCLAVRKVTQDNRGKKTAGVDGVKALSPPQRSDLVRTLSLTAKARPTRRVWIRNPVAWNSARWEFRPCEIGQRKRWQCSHSNLNGKRFLNPTPMGSVKDAPCMMQWKPSAMRSRRRPNMC
jgi:N-terminal domain of reverse transcriptase